MREPITLPRNPSEETKRLNPQYYGKAKAPEKVPAPKAPSPLEAKFLSLWPSVDIDGQFEPALEYRFAPPRRWRFDACWPSKRVALEMEGGVHNRGRHTRAKGFLADCDKYNRATVEGYAIFRLATGQVTEENLRMIFRFLKSRC